MRTINRFSLYTSVVPLLLSVGFAQAQVQPKMYDLGTLGGDFSEAVAINAHGQVVGTSALAGNLHHHAFLWTQGATDGVPSNPQMKDLGTLGGSYSYAVAINDRGQVIGNVSNFPGDFPEHAFLWTPGGTDGVPGNPQMKDLGTLGGSVGSIAGAINARGQVIGGSGRGQYSGDAFLWTPGATEGVTSNPQMKYLGTLGGVSASVCGLNDSGQVSGTSYLPGNIPGAPSHPFLWTSGGTDGVTGNPQMKDLGTFGGDYSLCGFINERGQITGFTATQAEAVHGFLWTPGATDGFPANPQMKDLGEPAPDVAFGLTINDSGQVAGTTGYELPSFIEQHAFLWTPGGTGGFPGNPQMRDLGTLGAFEGLSLSVATSMNALGRVAGYSTAPGPYGALSNSYHAFLWTPGGTDGVAGNPQMKDLGTLGTLGSTDAVAINDNDQVVGYSGSHAFLYGTLSIDNTKPVSQVSPLPASEFNANFIVQWSGRDTGSGILDFTIYVSDDGGPFIPWIVNTLAPRSTFAGTAKHSYGFYSIARDRTHNQDGPKIAADATTYVVSAGIGDVNADGQVNCLDIEIVKASFGKRTGQAGFDSRADVNHDGIVDVRDLASVSQQLVPGTKCP